jgi:hypothetical protein
MDKPYQDKIKCFLLVPNGVEVRSLRRYASLPEGQQCPLNPGKYSYHNSHVQVGVCRCDGDKWRLGPRDKYDAMWPTHCECGFEYTDSNSNKQLFTDEVYVSVDRPGEEFSIKAAPVGAMWEVPWYHDLKDMCGPDGMAYIVVTPGGQWHIDGRASNCGSPLDSIHKCWVRHGTAPNLTVDKNGLTCSAGAGSIQAGDYHGFLKNGHLVTNLSLV